MILAHLLLLLTYHLGQPFALKVANLPAGVVSLRVTLTSRCDNEKIVQSTASYRANGDYYAILTVPESAGACKYEVDTTYWMQDTEEDPMSASQEDIVLSH